MDNQLNKEKSLTKQYSYDMLHAKKNWKKSDDSNNMIGIIRKIRNMQSKVRYSYNQLLEEKKDNDMDYRALITLSEEKNNNYNKRTKDNLSPLAQKLLKKANNSIDKVKESTVQIAKLNYLFYANRPTNKITSSVSVGNKIKNKNKKNKYQNSELTKKTESELIQKLRDKSLVKNFVYINNDYHKQLHSAFMKYNPTAHLNNMKILLDAVPSFHEDISRELKEVENDINFKCDKFKFKKKFVNYLNKQTLFSYNRPKIQMSPGNKKLLRKSVSQPKIRITKEDKKSDLPLIFINKLKKSKGEEFRRYKQTQIAELKKLITISSDIKNMIGKDTIDQKIKNFVKDYDLLKYEHEISKRKSINVNFNKIDYFKSEKASIDDKLKSFYLKKYFNSVDTKESHLLNKLRSELNLFNNKNNSNRDVSLNELDNFLIRNEVMDIMENKENQDTKDNNNN